MGIFDHDEIRLLKELLEEFRELKYYLRERFGFPARGFKIYQLGAYKMQVQAGQTGVFQATVVPTGGALQAGAIPAWSVDDTNVTLTPSTDGFTVSAAVAASDTAASFNLTITGISSDGSTISDTVNVTITPVAPPPPTPATGFVITQLS